MSARKKYRPKHVNPYAHLIAMQGAQLLSDADRLKRTNALATAVEVACMGAAEHQHWALIVDSLNMAEMFARQKVAQGLDAIYAMQTTVETILDRRKATGSKALYLTEREDLRDFAEAYAELLRGVNHRQYFQAQEAAEIERGESSRVKLCPLVGC